MPGVDTVPVVITTITAPTAQVVQFPSYVEWLMFQNDSPIEITVLREDGAKILAHVMPGDVKPILMGDRQVNTIRLYGTAVSVALDIAENRILFIDYKCKRRE